MDALAYGGTRDVAVAGVLPLLLNFVRSSLTLQGGETRGFVAAFLFPEGERNLLSSVEEAALFVAAAFTGLFIALGFMGLFPFGVTLVGRFGAFGRTLLLLLRFPEGYFVDCGRVPPIAPPETDGGGFFFFK